MDADSAASSKPRRGRPRGSSADATRARILKAAGAEFAEHGYEAGTIRGIARRAEVDSALVHHYFESKAGVMAQLMKAPIRPDIEAERVLQGPLETAGPRLLRHLLEQMEKPAAQRAGVAMVRSGLGSKAMTPLIREFIQRELLGKIERVLTGEDARLRAGLFASQLVGVLIGRFVLRLDPLAQATVDELVERVGPVLQHYLTGALPEAVSGNTAGGASQDSARSEA